MESGRLIVFTAPSGAGKTTIVRYLLRKLDCLSFSISATTRHKRPKEIDGLDYHFISENDFKSKIVKDEFIEWEEFYGGSFYGTLKSEVDKAIKNGEHLIFDIDVKGAQSIKKLYGDKVLSVFVKPPSEELLFSRLTGRGTEDEDSLRKRKERAAYELTFHDKFDEVLINDDLETALNSAESMVLDFLDLKNN